jgi:membrane-associated phospholipid phosphatase
MFADPIWFWNDISLEVQRRDFEPFTNAQGEFGIAPEQAGPTRSSRALAMIHIAMYNALALADSSSNLTPYPMPAVPLKAGSSAPAAVCGAAAAMAITLFPRQEAFISGAASNYLSMLLGNGLPQQSVTDGFAFGQAVAAAHALTRATDKPIVEVNDNHLYVLAPGHHQPDPFAPGAPRLGATWGQLAPFCSTSPYKHEDYLDAWPDWRSTNPTESAAYFADFNQVKAKGPQEDSTRTAEETLIGLFWAYDGAWKVGTPPRLYNQCVRAALDSLPGGGHTTLSTAQLARVFALVNAGMADAGIIAWQAKYAYDLWRPVVGVRQQDTGFGPSNGSGSAVVNADPFWRPVGAPQTNQPGKFSITPNFPAYPSGHASFGTTCFELLRKFLAEAGKTTVIDGKDDIEFVATSDELNGKSIDPEGSTRTLHARELTLSKAIEENTLSRVYLGVHWKFDGTGPGTNHGWGGEAIGTKLAQQIFSSQFKVKQKSASKAPEQPAKVEA